MVITAPLVIEDIEILYLSKKHGLKVMITRLHRYWALFLDDKSMAIPSGKKNGGVFFWGVKKKCNLLLGSLYQTIVLSTYIV